MRLSRRGPLLGFATTLVAVMASSAPAAALAGTERITLDGGGRQVAGASVGPTLSADGHLVAFSSQASTLVAGDDNGTHDVFLHDRRTGQVELVSRNSRGEPSNSGGRDQSGFVSLNADGRFVAFSSWATNLVPGDTNGKRDVFVRDRTTGVTERVSVGTGGEQGDGDSGVYSQGISDDGRFVVFQSEAATLAPGDTNGVADVFVRDRETGRTQRLSATGAGAQVSASSAAPSISSDGRFVAFVANGALLPDDDNGT